MKDYSVYSRVGRVVSINGAKVVVLLDKLTLDSHDMQVGGLVKLVRPNGRVYGLIEALSIPLPRDEDMDAELRIAEIGLIGEAIDPEEGGDGHFYRGVSALPTLNDVVVLADHTDTSLVYAQPHAQAVTIGTLHQDSRVPACLSVDDMLGKHFAIVGATGSGKSCALVLILKGILDRNPHAHIVLLDPHGEYGQAFGEQVEHLNVRTFRFPYWLLNFEELVEVVFGDKKTEHASSVAILRDLVLSAKLSFAGTPMDASWITVDTPVPYALGEVNRLIEEATGRLDNRTNSGPYLHIKTRLAALQADRRYAFMFSTGVALRDELASLLGRIFRVPSNGRPITVLDLAGVPSEVLNVIVAVLCRMAFDFGLWNNHSVPLLLVCEEAHRYAPQATGVGFDPAKRALSRIAREGRKYGVSLGVLSQRPSDLDASILSQCSTMLAFRMTNEKDQEIIQATMSEASTALFTALPLLGNGEAVAVGEGVSVPMRLRILSLPVLERPRSSSASFSQRWQRDDVKPGFLDKIVASWRGQKID
jgi:DNA helicase HerA-like ATPase